jgi:hypothetical protein
MAAHFWESAAASQQAEISALEQRANAQQHYYWRVRLSKALEALEREARRVFHLEEELATFAGHYYEVVGAATERLNRLEQQMQTDVISGAPTHHATMVDMPNVLAQCDVRTARRGELKQRYRTLAKKIHPDRAMVVSGMGEGATQMQVLNAAYQQGDLAGLLKLEAKMSVAEITTDSDSSTRFKRFEQGVRAIERATETYADSYRTMLRSPINELMLRAMSAKLAGWDWMEAVLSRVERSIEEKEQALGASSVIQRVA